MLVSPQDTPMSLEIVSVLLEEDFLESLIFSMLLAMACQFLTSSQNQVKTSFSSILVKVDTHKLGLTIANE